MAAPRCAARRRRGRRLTPRRRGAVRSVAFAALLGAGWLVGPGPAAGGGAGGVVATEGGGHAALGTHGHVARTRARTGARPAGEGRAARRPSAQAHDGARAEALAAVRRAPDAGGGAEHRARAGSRGGALRRTSAARGVPLRVMRCRRSLPVSATTSVVAAASSASPCGAMNCPAPVPSVPITSHVPGALVEAQDAVGARVGDVDSARPRGEARSARSGRRGARAASWCRAPAMRWIRSLPVSAT